MNIYYLVIFLSLFYLSYCSIELSIGSFITSAITSNDFSKKAASAFYWGKNIYRFIKDINNVAGQQPKPNLNKISNELMGLDQRMRESSKELKQILLDQHFQTHIELPTFALYRHVTSFILNPTTKIYENELIEACSQRHSPNDILSNLLFLLQKQWILQRLKENTYKKNAIIEIQIVIENIIKKLVITQSLCIELRYNVDSEPYRIGTMNMVEEIRELFLKQIEDLKETLINRNYRPCPQKATASNQNPKEESTFVTILKSPYYLLRSLYYLLSTIFQKIIFSIYYSLMFLFNCIKYVFVSIFTAIFHIFCYLKDFLILIVSFVIRIIVIIISHVTTAVSIALYFLYDMLACSLKPMIVSVFVVAIYDDFYGDQRIRNALGFE